MSPAFDESHPGVPAGLQGARPWTPRLRFGTGSLLTCTHSSCNCPLLLESNSFRSQVRRPSCNLSGAAVPRVLGAPAMLPGRRSSPCLLTCLPHWPEGHRLCLICLCVPGPGTMFATDPCSKDCFWFPMAEIQHFAIHTH